MNPPLRFAGTADGGHVAYAHVGSGYPLLDITSGPPRNVAVEWQTPGFADHYQALTRHFHLIRMEPRGNSHSSPFPRGKKYAEWILEDIDAVVSSMRLDRFAMVAAGAFVGHAIEYAASRPEVVSHLVLVSPFKPPDSVEGFKIFDQLGVATSPADRSLALARMMMPGADPAHVATIAPLLQADNWDAEHLEQVSIRNREFDPMPFLRQVRAATLVIATVEPFVGLARSIAAGIADSQLVIDLSAPRDIAYTLDPSFHQGYADRLAAFVGRISVAGATPRGARPSSPILDKLTAREFEVLRLISSGQNNSEIAESLGLSIHTIERHLANLYGKLGVHNRTQAAAWLLGGLSE